MDDLAWLRLQMEWGADEALDDRPVDRRSPGGARAPRRAPPAAAFPLRPRCSDRRRRPGACPGPGGCGATPAELRRRLPGSTAAPCVRRRPTWCSATATRQPGWCWSRTCPAPPRTAPASRSPGRRRCSWTACSPSAGLDRAACLATSLLPWRPPGDRKPTDGEIQLCLPFLLRHLALLRRAQVLLFGSLAARTLLPAEPDGRPGWQDLPVPGLASPCRLSPSRPCCTSRRPRRPNARLGPTCFGCDARSTLIN